MTRDTDVVGSFIMTSVTFVKDPSEQEGLAWRREAVLAHEPARLTHGSSHYGSPVPPTRGQAAPSAPHVVGYVDHDLSHVRKGPFSREGK